MNDPKHNTAPTSMPPHAQLMQFITGRWVSQTIGFAAEVGLADLVHQGKTTVSALAEATHTDPEALRRVLRALASLGIFAETSDGRFVATPLSDPLRSDSPVTVRAMARFVAHEIPVRAWTMLKHSVETGQPALEKVTGMQGFAFLEKDPAMARIFNEAMSSFSSQEAAAIVDAYDFSSAERIVDVGGGHGFLLAAILARNPKPHGAIFEMPHAVEGAKQLLAQRGLTARTEVHAGDAMEAIRPTGVDVCLMKHIIHDWDDVRSRRFLSACHAALKPGGRMLVCEMVMPPGNEPHMAKWLDLEMLVLTPGGKERTESEFRALFESVGFRFSRIVPTHSPISVIEGIKP